MRKMWLVTLLVALAMLSTGAVRSGGKEPFREAFTLGPFRYALPEGWVYTEKGNSDVLERNHYARRVSDRDGGYVCVRTAPLPIDEETCKRVPDTTLKLFYEGLSSNSDERASEKATVAGCPALRGYYVDSESDVLTGFVALIYRNKILCFTYSNTDGDLSEREDMIDRIIENIAVDDVTFFRSYQYSEDWMQFYKHVDYADYDRTDPDLIQRLIQFSGVVKEKSKLEDGMYGWIVEQEDGYHWLAVMREEIDNVEIGDQVTCYGSFIDRTVDHITTPCILLLRYSVFCKVANNGEVTADLFEGYSFNEVQGKKSEKVFSNETFTLGPFRYALPAGWVYTEIFPSSEITRMHYARWVSHSDGGYVYVSLRSIGLNEDISERRADSMLEKLYESLCRYGGEDYASKKTTIDGCPALRGHISYFDSDAKDLMGFVALIYRNKLLLITYNNTDGDLSEREDMIDRIIKSIEIDDTKFYCSYQYDEDWMQFYQRADHDDYKEFSPKLIGKLLQFSGVVTYKSALGASMNGWIIKQDDGGLWLAIMREEIDRVKVGDHVTCYGSFFEKIDVPKDGPTVVLLRYSASYAVLDDGEEIADDYEGYSFNELKG